MSERGAFSYAASARARSASRSMGSSRPTERRTMPSVIPCWARCSGVKRWCVVVGVGDEALGVAEVVGDHRQLEGVEESEGGGLAAGELEGHQRAARGHLLARQIMLGMAGEAGIEKLAHLLLSGEEIGDACRVGAMARDAKLQGLQPLQQQPGIHRLSAGPVCRRNGCSFPRPRPCCPGSRRLRSGPGRRYAWSRNRRRCPRPSPAGAGAAGWRRHCRR